jgi:hypothetical protein
MTLPRSSRRRPAIRARAEEEVRRRLVLLRRYPAVVQHRQGAAVRIGGTVREDEHRLRRGVVPGRGGHRLEREARPVGAVVDGDRGGGQRGRDERLDESGREK